MDAGTESGRRPGLRRGETIVFRPQPFEAIDDAPSGFLFESAGKFRNIDQRGAGQRVGQPLGGIELQGFKRKAPPTGKPSPVSPDGLVQTLPVACTHDPPLDLRGTVDGMGRDGIGTLRHGSGPCSCQNAGDGSGGGKEDPRDGATAVPAGTRPSGAGGSPG